MIETYRVLGREWEKELLREARRLQATEGARGVTPRRRGRRVGAFCGSALALLTRLRAAIPHPVSAAD